MIFNSYVSLPEGIPSQMATNEAVLNYHPGWRDGDEVDEPHSLDHILGIIHVLTDHLD